MKTFKKVLPDSIIVLLFALISFAYFIVPILQNKILYQHDSEAAVGLEQEIKQYRDKTGETSRWTNAIFSGMPTYQIAPSYSSTDNLSMAMDAYHLWLPNYVWFLFAYLLGFYILLRAFDFRPYLAALGSIFWAFSSYFLIIIAAGHVWKVMALAYLPPMIAGLVLLYKEKYLWGFVVTALFTAFEIKANHYQMTYYYLFIILFIIISYFVQAVKNKSINKFFKATGIAAFAALIGIAINISSLYHTWQYQKQSIRGKSELVTKTTPNQTSSGLNRDYITQWSYGIDETLTLLVPKAKGGASQPLSNSEVAMGKANPQIQEMIPGIYQGMTQYFGSQPGTSGPVYVGAFVVFLFILGIFIVRNNIKWALLAATILSIVLSWGHNFMWFTNLFIDYVPMYAKFRTVASILVIAEFTIPLLAILALKQIIDEPDILKIKIKYVYVSIVLTLGTALLLTIFPDIMGPFVSKDEQQLIASIQGITPDIENSIISSITTMRAALVSHDARNSVYIILIGIILLFCFYKRKLKANYLIACLTVLCLVDLWSNDKDYLNDGMFVEKSQRDMPRTPSSTDLAILKDKSLSYRVLNFAENTFNDNSTSYFHKSIGGYHPAKLQRYQELIERYIAPEMKAAMTEIMNVQGNMKKINGRKVFPVLNMLNAKYFILPLNNGTIPIRNIYAQGNAWFIDKIQYVNTTTEEYEDLDKIDLSKEAVADKKNREILGYTSHHSESNTVKLTHYEPNNLRYTVNSVTGGIIVFSEIYYPGWTATVDGKLTPIGRVNYVLRAINIKPGKHEVVFDFNPKSITVTETIAYVAMGILVLAIILLCVRIYMNICKSKNIL